jgi:hypothetical protein
LPDHHRKSAGRIKNQTDHIGTLAAKEVADLAADQDEGSGHQRLDCHRRLNAAHRRVEIPDDR